MTAAQQDAFALLCNANFELNCLRIGTFQVGNESEIHALVQTISGCYKVVVWGQSQ